MKLVFFNEFKLGVLQDDMVVDISAVVKDISAVHPQDMIVTIIKGWSDYRPSIEEIVSNADGIPSSSVRLRAPLPRPSNIDCMAANYIEEVFSGRIFEMNGFQKTANGVIGDGDTMVLPDAPASIFEGEAELAVIVGKRGANIRAADAMSYVFGYTNLIDGSARGLSPASNFYQMKSRDTFCPIGPALVTADEISDPHKLSVRLWVNGTLMQEYFTGNMAHDIPHCIEYVSAIHTIEVGDIITTGTVHGGLSPFMDGDLVELETEGLGRLHINVRDDLKRTWARETRLQRFEKKLEGATTPQLAGKYVES